MTGHRSWLGKVASGCLLLLAGCEGAATDGSDPAASARQAAGAATADYAEHCAACHGADGRGIDERYPSLHFDAEDWANAGPIIRQVLGGSHRYTSGTAMPDHGFLGNESLAAILSYVRAQFGPGGTVAIEEVAEARLDLVQGFHDRDAVEGTAANPLVAGQRQSGPWLPPPMSPAAHARAQAHYERYCTGCHGVFRTGTAGNPLPPAWMRELGTEYLRQVIGFGTDRGMPTWLDEGGLTPADVHDLAVFLQHPLPPPSKMDLATIGETWVLDRPVAERPAAPRHGYDLDQMWVVALHDPGAVLLIDGASRQPVATIPVLGSPHRILASPSGRYLHVVSRNGVVAIIDLYAGPPERVASVRVGLEARSLGQRVADGRPRLLAAADWPPQFVLLDGETLEPLERLDSMTLEDVEAVSSEVGDVIGSRLHPEFAALLRGTGEIVLLGNGPGITVRRIAGEPTLRSATPTAEGRHLLIPTDTRKLLVFDLLGREIVGATDLPFAGAGHGVVYEHAEYGPVWVTGSLLSDQLVVVAADAGSPLAWQVIEEVDGPAEGSLFLATHPESRHLWVDTPLAEVGHASREVAVYDRDDLDAGPRSLPIAAWADLDAGPQRVLQPSYSADGSEVWMLVWNPGMADSAIVIVDDETLEAEAVLRFDALRSPTRLYSVAALRAASEGRHSPQ